MSQAAANDSELFVSPGRTEPEFYSSYILGGPPLNCGRDRGGERWGRQRLDSCYINRQCQKKEFVLKL